MKTCNECDHVSRQGSEKPAAWTCDVFPQDRLDPLTGGELPPYRYCRDVLRLTCPNDVTPCTFFKALPEVGEAVVKEARGEKSVTFNSTKKGEDNG